MLYTEERFDFHDCSQTEIANIEHLVHIPVCLNFNCPKMYFYKPFPIPKEIIWYTNIEELIAYLFLLSYAKNPTKNNILK